MENLSDYGPEALLELHAQEKQLTERLQQELQNLQNEVTQIERDLETNEEGELNEINKRLVRLKYDNHMLKTRQRHETRTVNLLLTNDLETIKMEREKLNKVQESIVLNDSQKQAKELKDLQQILSSCQEKMSSNSLDDESISSTLKTLLDTLNQFDESLTKDAANIEQKAAQARSENQALQKAIDEATAGLSFVRRRTCVGNEIQREIMNTIRTRRHSEASPFSLRKRPSKEEKAKP